MVIVAGEKIPASPNLSWHAPMAISLADGDDASAENQREFHISHFEMDLIPTLAGGDEGDKDDHAEG